MKKPTFVQPDPQTWIDSFHFEIPIKIRYCETDMLGHVNNVSYFMYFEQGRIEYFEHLGLTEDLFSEKHVSVVADLECQYLAQLYLKDPLKLRVKVAEIGRSSMDVHYAVVVRGELKAAGRGTIVLIDTATGKSTPIPDAAKERILAFEGTRT
ncbi:MULTISPECIES: thioesterase family protein [Paenibacillus]|uniref:Thioesterase superfamily protein n=2 Tax=Paenibacillus lactis TaxID=228574 RepID=G4HKA5_9BACL|nr:thioesterase family protein [Paenibacillus lactis]EHB62306.1 thioesterase superfamily protein [Paenibacillus lactis 154]MBP1895657.1 acyl-CoA thioester hydrolase [Paenibacillus lactis]MCM3495992.1 acyl-CoA thioesterase [Paenibacillus lactis]HAG00014.1 acyl-CoA thioesterase [Paenibacillus lactis]